jgi:hypothetical protein
LLLFLAGLVAMVVGLHKNAQATTCFYPLRDLISVTNMLWK